LLLDNSKSIVQTISTWLSKTKFEIEFYGSSEINQKCIVDCLSVLKDFETPDGYSVIDDTIYILEHFEFDSTVATKSKGSKTRRETDRIGKDFGKTNPSSANKSVLVKESYNINHSASNYIKNFLINANKHYTRIDSYIKNLDEQKKMGNIKNIKTGFFIEDKTILGNVYCERVKVENLKVKNIPETKIAPTILCFTKQFLDWFTEKKKLDFCLCASNYGDKHFLWFINRESINEYRKHEVNMESIEIIDFKPQVVGIKTLLESKDNTWNKNSKFEIIKCILYCWFLVSISKLS